MRYQVCEGNYARMGITKDKDSVIFTFEGEKEDKCEIVLVNRNTMCETRILASQEFCMGSLRSVSMKHIDYLILLCHKWSPCPRSLCTGNCRTGTVE